MTDDIPALIERLLETFDCGGHTEEERALVRLVGEALTVSPLPAPGEAAAAAVCHDEQLVIWADEFVEHLHAAASDFVPDFETYGIKIMYFSAVKDAIKDLVEKAFTHPELEKAPVVPLPEEITGLIYRLNNPAYLTFTDGRSLYEDETVKIMKSAATALERIARENEELRTENAKAFARQIASEDEISRLQKERDAVRAKTIEECVETMDGYKDCIETEIIEHLIADIRILSQPPEAEGKEE